jgi:hypothetical protein
LPASVTVVVSFINLKLGNVALRSKKKLFTKFGFKDL